MLREMQSIAWELHRDADGNYTETLCGDWPELTKITPGALPALRSGALLPDPSTPVSLGDDFIVQIGNQRAQYRFMEEDILGNMVCRRIRPAV